MLMNTMLTPIRKFIVSLWPNRAQLMMAVNIVAMVLLYFLRMVSANCSNSSTQHPDGQRMVKCSQYLLAVPYASRLLSCSFAREGLDAYYALEVEVEADMDKQPAKSTQF